MTTFIKLNNYNDPQSFIEKIKDKNIIVYEDIQGSKIFIKYTGSGFLIKPKSIDNEPLSFLDLAIQKFYNRAFIFFHSLPEYITNLLNKNWWFGFEYFADDQPANIEYKRLPKNNLILTCIVKGSKYFYNTDEIIEYSRLFEVEPLPVIFKGKLNEKQLEVINLFLNTSEEDLKYIFNENNFAFMFYKTLNTLHSNSFLMNEGEFNDNLEKLVIKIEGNEDMTFELLNPLYRRLNINTTEYTQVYSMILVDFIEYSQLKDLKDYKLNSITKDELYLEIISVIFNDYMTDIKEDILNWNFAIPKFFDKEKFKINLELIDNKKTVELLKIDPKIEYIFKVILGAMNHRKKKVVGVFTEQTLKLFNDLVDKISSLIDKTLKINREIALQKGDLKNFKDYFSLKYSVDATGKSYPDTTKPGEEMGGDGKKKKIKTKKGI